MIAQQGLHPQYLSMFTMTRLSKWKRCYGMKGKDKHRKRRKDNDRAHGFYQHFEKAHGYLPHPTLGIWLHGLEECTENYLRGGWSVDFGSLVATNRLSHTMSSTPLYF